MAKRKMRCQFCGKKPGPHKCIDWSKIDPPSVSLRPPPQSVEVVRDDVQNLLGQMLELRQKVRTKDREAESVRLELEALRVEHGALTEDWDREVERNRVLRDLNKQLGVELEALRKFQVDAQRKLEQLRVLKNPDAALEALDVARERAREYRKATRRHSLWAVLFASALVAAGVLTVVAHPAAGIIMAMWAAFALAGSVNAAKENRKLWRESLRNVQAAESNHFVSINWWASSGGDEEKE